MREIDNNKLNRVNFQSIPKMPAGPIETAETEPIISQEGTEFNDLSALPSATLGKSQVIAPEGTETDMKFFEENPELASAIIDAVDNYAQNHSEEETLQMLEKCHQEFVK